MTAAPWDMHIAIKIPRDHSFGRSGSQSVLCLKEEYAAFFLPKIGASLYQKSHFDWIRGYQVGGKVGLFWLVKLTLESL